MDKALLISEVTFKAVRSSGPGGQNVNKVASKVIYHSIYCFQMLYQKMKKPIYKLN